MFLTTTLLMGCCNCNCISSGKFIFSMAAFMPRSGNMCPIRGFRLYKQAYNYEKVVSDGREFLRPFLIESNRTAVGIRGIEAILHLRQFIANVLKNNLVEAGRTDVTNGK